LISGEQQCFVEDSASQSTECLHILKVVGCMVRWAPLATPMSAQCAPLTFQASQCAPFSFQSSAVRSIQFSGINSVLHSLCHTMLPAILIFQKFTSCSNVAVVCCSLYVSNSFIDSKQRTFVTLCRKPLYVWLSNEDLDSQLKEPLP